MKPELQRIRIAEACDLEIINDPRGPIDTRKSPYTLKRKVFYTPEAARIRYQSWPRAMTVPVIPDYPTNINAIFEAVNYFTETHGFAFQEKYVGELRRAVTKRRRDCNETQITFWMSEATAAQRAEAFLKALGLWEDA